MNTINVNFSKPYGKVKTYNAVNNGPVKSIRGLSNMDAWRNAKLPYGRLHDTSYTDEWLVDVHRIFRDFDADETDPKNYVFGPTDKYLANMFEVGTEPYYRLGASIEHSHKLGTYPPKDHLKWARICEHIIRHYTEGWADGFNYEIKYWEIWNEPDNYNASGNPCWQGEWTPFCDFFCTVCPYLQEKFPDLSIGGPALATTNHEDLVRELLGTMRDRGVRPDFISYHRYTKSIEDFVAYVRRSNALFAEYGYGDVETHINEWNYVRGWRGEEFIHSVQSIKGLKGAAFVAAAMCALHPEKLDMLMYYEGRNSVWSGLWDLTFLTPLKAYYPFIAWSELKDLGTAVETANDEFLYSIGATDGRDAALLCSYFNQEDGIPAKEVRLEIRGLKLGKGERIRAKVCPIDNEHNLDCVRTEIFSSGDFDMYLDFPPYTVYYVKLIRECCES